MLKIFTIDNKKKKMNQHVAPYLSNPQDRIY